MREEIKKRIAYLDDIIKNSYTPSVIKKEMEEHIEFLKKLYRAMYFY